MSEALHRATLTVREADLPRLVLRLRDFPAALQHFLPARDGELDNETMAQQGFPGSSAARFRAMGRLTGYVREFAAPMPEGGEIPVGYDLFAATVVHLFENPAGVSRWIDEVFLGDFSANVDQELQPGQRLLVAERLPFEGFVDEVAGLRALQSGTPGPVSSTIVDFRIGRLLGVAYVATLGNCERTALVAQLGRELERRFVAVALEAR